MGRELERKVETVILLSGTGQVTKVSTLMSRNKPIRGEDCVQFEFSEEAGRHVTLDPAEDGGAKVHRFLLECWRNREAEAFTQADIFRNTPSQRVSVSTKRNWIVDLEEEGFISRDDGGVKAYSLTPKGRDLIHYLEEGEEVMDLMEDDNG